MVHSKIVDTQLYNPGKCNLELIGGEPSIITVTLHETDEITSVASLIRFASKADREEALSNGMADDMPLSFEALDVIRASQFTSDRSPWFARIR